jgi:signal transduction histidine kinase
MAGVSAVGFFSIRKDLENLRTISQDNILWSATQMEVELLRFQRSLAVFASEQSEAALEDLHQRFDILWSRVNLMIGGRVGSLLREYDVGFGTLGRLATYLETIDPIILGLSPGEPGPIPTILAEMEDFQQDLRLYTLRVVRGDTAAATLIRDRMRRSSQITAFIGLAALVISLLSLFLIMRDNVRQRQMASLNLRQAEAAEAASRAKSRFLTMMSHELRNPLNGILGPLALLAQTGMDDKHRRLIEKAQQSGRTMLRMLRGLLDYGDIQDERLVLKREAFRPRALAEEIRVALVDIPTDGRPHIEVRVEDGVPELMWGDADRLAQVFVYIGEYMLQPSHSGDMSVVFSYNGKDLVGDIGFADPHGDVGWKLDLLSGMTAEGAQAFSTDALGPLIAKGLLSAAKGLLTLPQGEAGGRAIQVLIPAESVVFEKIRVHLETRSSALETLYRAALKSDRVEFLAEESATAAEIVLVDTTSIGERSLMSGLRARFPDALFVSLGPPSSPGFFDDIVETPHDMVRLRKSVLGRLAS